VGIGLFLGSSCFTVQGCVMRGHLKEGFKEYVNKTCFFFYQEKKDRAGCGVAK